MDDKRFDEISRFLGTSVSRQGVFKLLAGFGAAGASALGGLELIDAKKRKNKDKDKDSDGGANAEGKKKKGKRKKKGKKRQKNTANAQTGCNQSGKVLICHNTGSGTNPYTSNCISKNAACQAGHGHHDGDCVCGGSEIDCPGPGNKIPVCDPSVVDCSKDTSTCQPAVVTCDGSCDNDNDCPDLDNCVCNKQSGGDRSHQDKGTCGAPVCGGYCKKTQDCRGLDNCVCNKKQGDGSNDWGYCGPPQTCAGECWDSDDCPKVDNCVCTKNGKTSGGSKGTCVTPTTTTTPEQTTTTTPEQTTTTPEQTTTTTPEQTTTTPEQTTTTPEQTTTTPQQTTTTTLVPGCVPDPIEVACAGLACGPASDNCGNDIECGTCGRKKSKKKGRRGRPQICVSGVCKATGKKRCVGSGLAGQPCGGKKCKCAGGRRCNNGKCCEPVGDGSVHCTANSDCCPGLMCARRRPGQHKVCMRKNAKSEGEFGETTETSTPSLAIGALLTGLALKGGERWFGSAGTNAPIALDELGNQNGQREV